MKRKMIIVTVGIGLVIAGLSVYSFAKRGHHGFAHGWHHGPAGFSQHHEILLERLIYRLELSAEQRQKAFAILDELRPTARNLRFAFADHRRALRRLDPTAADYKTQLKGRADEVGKLATQMVLAHGEAYAQIAALLTDEQREKLRTMRGKHGRKRLERNR